MNYTHDQFFRLVDAIEADGGVHLDVAHEKVFYDELCGGPIKDALQGAVDNNNCGESVLFDVPYVSILSATVLDGQVVVCAKDDMMGLWPRYASANAKGQV